MLWPRSSESGTTVGSPAPGSPPLRSTPPSLQIAVQNPLVSERMELSVLYKEYADDDNVYQQKIKVTVASGSHKGGAPFPAAGERQELGGGCFQRKGG